MQFCVLAAVCCGGTATLQSKALHAATGTVAAALVFCAYLSAIQASACADTRGPLHAWGSHAAHTCLFSTALADLQVCTCVGSWPHSV